VTTPSYPARILQIHENGKEWFAMLAGTQLDVFTPLDDGPLRADDLALACGVDAGKLSLLLYALAVAGLLSVEDGRFANTPETAHFFVRGKPSYIGSTHTFWREWGVAAMQTAESVRTGIPQGQHKFAEMNEAELLATLGGLHASGVARGHEVGGRYDFSAVNTVLDAAGGSGGMSIGLVQQYPHLRATVADLPNVVPIAQRFIQEAALGDNIDTVAVDLLREAPPGAYDVALASYLVQVLSASHAQLALRHIAAALRPGGTIYLINMILDASRLTPAGAARTNLLFLNWYDGGQAYTEDECRAMLTDAGFVDITREADLSDPGLMLARKPE
jgi:hypothetical protein